MMKQIVFATNNKHKLEEVKSIMDKEIQILSLEDIKCYDDIPETADTIQGNALLKAHYIKDKYGYDCFSDDTGLEIKSLNNEPGVYSARYAGLEHDSSKNRQKVLDNLKGKENRDACFKTCIALILNGKIHCFEGKIEGTITTEPKGESGFGYDPIFKPNGYDLTFSELGNDLKNKISHRYLAVQKLVEFLKTL